MPGLNRSIFELASSKLFPNTLENVKMKQIKAPVVYTPKRILPHACVSRMKHMQKLLCLHYNDSSPAHTLGCANKDFRLF